MTNCYTKKITSLFKLSFIFTTHYPIHPTLHTQPVVQLLLYYYYF